MTESYLDILSQTIRNNWDQPALTDFYLTEDGSAQDISRGNHYTYGEMYAEIVRVADLLTSLGLQKGDHIAICGANSSHWVIAYLAIAKMQGVSVTIMQSLTTPAIYSLVDFSDSKAIFVDPDIWEELDNKPLPQVQSVINTEDWSILRGNDIRISNLQSPISNNYCHFPYLAPDTVASICFTSGTTGRAKGIMMPEKRIGNNINSHVVDIQYNISSNSTILLLPLAHTYGLEQGLLLPLVNAKHIFILKELLTEVNLLNSVIVTKPNVLCIIPHIYTSLLKAYGDKFMNIISDNSVQLVIAGAKLAKEDENAIIFNSKIFLSIGYGNTELGIISFSPYKAHRSQSCGKIVSGMTVHIASNGEILVKGENVMHGYYKDPEATAQKIDKDGWLHTGDKGHLDEDGYLYVEGRLEQDFIVLPNGENIHPDNIEFLINALPEVSESIVLARDGKLVAIVVPKSPISNLQCPMSNNTNLKLNVLHQINPQLPLFSQLYDVEITDVPLQRTEKQTLKRYLYK